MPDKFGFNELGSRVMCIETGCDTGGPMYEWNQKRREVHYLTHFIRMEGDSPVFDGETKVTKCRVCSREFEQERKRGRPRVLCYVCKPS